MINMCGSCIHRDSCYGSNDDYSEDGGLCDHFRIVTPGPKKPSSDALKEVLLNDK